MGKQKPVKASEVETETELSEDELEAQQRKSRLRGRLAKRAVLRKVGAMGPGSDTNAGRIEDRLARTNAQQMAEFRKREGK